MTQSSTELFRTSCGAAVPLELKVSGPGWTNGERRVFDQPFVVAGRHERASLRLEDAAVSRRHVYLQQFGGQVFCVDLGSRAGIRWGGEARRAGWLRPDQGIQVGPFTLELATASAVAGPRDEVAEDGDPLQDRVDDSELLPRITVESDNKVLAHMRMNRTLVLVGSAPACRLRLREHGIAPYHCSLVRTPEGVWMIDLLNETETCLDGQPVRWALVKEGGQLQVGPYLLRLSYPSVPAATPLCRVLEIRAETGAQSAEDTPDCGRRPFQDEGVPAQDLAVPRAGPFADEGSRLVHLLQAELDQARERLRDAETLREQLADTQAECDRLRDQVRTFEGQLADVAGLQARLEAAEASARQLKRICAEGDQWQERLEAAQQQLVKEREAVCAARLRLDQESSALQGIRTDLAVRNAEYSAALQRLQATQDKLGRSQDEIRGLQTELNQLHEQLGDTEALREQLADSQAECDRLRDQAGTHENQVAEIAELQARLEAAEAGARQLEIVCAERDQWRQRLEAAQGQLVEEREAVSAARQRLEQESAALEGIRADLAVRNAEYSAALQRLQATQNEFGRSQDEIGGLQTELNQLHEQLGDTEALREQLADSQAECVRLRDQAGTHENQVAEIAELQARLEAAEAGARQLEIVCAERDQWQAEVQTLQTRLASDPARQEQFDCLAEELHSAREERDRLLAEQQTSLDLTELARTRVSELEQALTEAAADHERIAAETSAHWESERQVLQARLEQERQAHQGAAQTALRDFQVRAEAAIREVQARAAADRETWQKRLEGAEAQIVWERGLFQEQGEKLRQQLVGVQTERDRLAARLGEAESLLRTAQQRPRDEAGRVSEPEPQPQVAVLDQIFVEFGRMKMAHMLGRDARRPDQEKTDF